MQKYPAPGYENATIATSGCGPVSAAMAAAVLTSQDPGPAEIASLAVSCGARVSGGTDMAVLSKAICDRYGLKMYREKNLRELEKWEAAIVNVGGDRSGYFGFYSSGGHYILCLPGWDGGFIVCDPGWYSGKYSGKSRRGRAKELTRGITWASFDLIATEAASRYMPFYIFSRK